MKKSIFVFAALTIISVLIICCKPIQPPDLLVQPSSLNFGEIDSVKTITIINEGDERLDWTVDTGLYYDSWLSIDPLSGFNETTLSVKVSRANLQHGSYKTNFNITSNGGDASVEVVMIVF
jgi:hypothetical protein